ncbi:MAG: hypothetical protein UU61_C0005G0011 [Parcubacteria group bacterium GW2011_GWB1_41_4]|nr:MAG: hypothetical protein UU61_C0005G0011 [Parcubacteria group bacterium GW2011_GWB1_41_4]
MSSAIKTDTRYGKRKNGYSGAFGKVCLKIIGAITIIIALSMIFD